MRINEAAFPSFNFQPLRGEYCGALVSADGALAVPTVKNFAFFNEADLNAPTLLENKCRKLAAQLDSDAAVYQQFVRQKGRRPNYDIYACFMPFSEAFKAFFPLIPAIKKRLKPEEVILNLWDRTGYAATLLAGLFPEQHIINIWEGDRDTLGYKGFNFWFGRQCSGSENHVQIAFADLNDPLPFADHSIGMVLGFDTFHRFEQAKFLREMVRITKPEGAILFPHVHLSNAEPDPFFERGCRQLHGTTYAAAFETLLTGSGRNGYLFPEPEMFLFNEMSKEAQRPIVSEPNSKHYNSFIAFLPANWEQEEQLCSYGFAALENPADCRILLNPLLKIDWTKGLVKQDSDHLEQRAAYLLERHPVYLKKLITSRQLNEQELKILYWAKRLKTVAEIAATLQLSVLELLAILESLQQGDVIQVLPLGKEHLRLQNFVSSQHYLLPEEQQIIPALWARAVRLFSNNTFIVSAADESEISYQEANALIEMIAIALTDSGLEHGDRLALIGPKHFEAILTIIAANQLGIVVVPIDYELAPPVIEQIVAATQPKLIFSDTASLSHLTILDLPLIQFDSDENRSEVIVFSDWLENVPPDLEVELPAVQASDLACILYTSGSTGIPKGVQLNHGQLVRSGRLITETFHWDATDRFFSPGELDSMSGFRNHCIAPLEVGAAVIIPLTEQQNQLFAIVDGMEEHRATILGTTPPLLGQLIRYHERLKTGLRTLRQVICTGSNLPVEMRLDFKAAFKIPLLNYYGLTETTGICISEDPDNFQLDKNTIGIPRDCIAQVVNEQGEIVEEGEEGRLRIYSDNLTAGYYNSPERTANLLINGWLYTGDTACHHENGHFSLLGRSREIIKLASGNLVFASEIENCLLACKNIISQVAITAYEEDGQEKIVAFICRLEVVVNDETIIAQLKEHVKEKLGSRKIPSRWIILKELPITANGKVRKTKLAEEYLRS